MSHNSNTPSAIILLPLLILVVFIVLGGRFMRSKGYPRGGGNDVVVRCRQGHLFTTIWIPLVSLKAVRLGPLRYQHCPVGHHWSLVDIVNLADLSDTDLRLAAEHHDLRIP
jgi:hypothetical protein